MPLKLCALLAASLGVGKMPLKGSTKGNKIVIDGDKAYIHMYGGHVAIIDAEDVDTIKDYTWCFASTVGVMTKSVDNHCRLLSRMILFGENYEKGGTEIADHRNHNLLDNTKVKNDNEGNLRICTWKQNCYNQISRGGTSHYKGVSWSKEKRMWKTLIKHNYRSIHIGYFKKEEDAARAYDKKARELFGEFAYLNFSERRAA